ncbi:MAG: Dyp-type peroxidase, partial [Acidimicrobiales bacterium]
VVAPTVVGGGTTMSRLELADVQGLVVSGYGRAMPVSRFLVLRVDDPARARRWAAELADRVTSAERPEELRCINVAFTADGLRALGVAPDDLRSFPPPFREGMVAAHRQRILGDTGASDPATWAWGGTERTPTATDVHALVLIYARDDDAFAAALEDEQQRLVAGGLSVVHTVEPRGLPGRDRVGKFGTEHFGFADGMSQPVVQGSGQEDALVGDDARRNVIAAGEFVLGYPNGYGQRTPWPTLGAGAGDGAAFGRNASYLVVRQLAQDVAGFWKYLDDNSRDAEARELLAAKLVGRWRSGAPLVKSAHRDDPDLGTDNSFGYAKWDRHGQRCPLGSHIRRTNPRDSLGDDPDKALTLANLHRIVRRGRVYGPDLDNPLGGPDGRERGLVFMCLNANLERQFEFVQHSWCNGPTFAGLYGELDPVVATQPADGGVLTVQAEPARRRLTTLPTFVTTRGGGYFFLPGLAALRQLGRLAS